jgi:hypothetical protein
VEDGGSGRRRAQAVARGSEETMVHMGSAWRRIRLIFDLFFLFYFMRTSQNFVACIYQDFCDVFHHKSSSWF